MKKLIPIFLFYSFFSFGQDKVAIPKVKKTFYPIQFRRLDVEDEKSLPIYEMDRKAVYETDPKSNKLKYTLYRGNSSEKINEMELYIIEFNPPNSYLVYSLTNVHIVVLSDSMSFVTAFDGKHEYQVSNSIDNLPITPYGVEKYPFIDHLTAQSTNKVLDMDIDKANHSGIEVNVQADSGHFVFYTIPGNDDLFFTNHLQARNTQSYGLVTGLTYNSEQNYYFFYWEFANTYDDVVGVASVFIYYKEGSIHSDIYFRDQVSSYKLIGQPMDLYKLEKQIKRY